MNNSVPVTARADEQAASTTKMSPNRVPKSQVVPELEDISGVNTRAPENEFKGSSLVLPPPSLSGSELRLVLSL